MTVFDDKGVLMIRMSRQEALCTIRSLTNQLITNNCNADRMETFIEGDGRDFSIAVVDPANQNAEYLRRGIRDESAS